MFKNITLFLFFILVGCSDNKISLELFDIDNKETVEVFIKTLINEGITESEEFILRNDIDINVNDSSGKTLLLLSLLDENYSLANKLLLLGADPNGAGHDYKKISIIGWAASYKDSSFLKLLLSFGGNPNLVTDSEWPESTPIFESILVNNIENIKLLISKGADLNFEARNGYTPIMLAASIGNWEILYLFLKSEPNYLYENRFGETVFTYIENQGLGLEGEQGKWRNKVLKYFKESGVKLD